MFCPPSCVCVTFAPIGAHRGTRAPSCVSAHNPPPRTPPAYGSVFFFSLLLPLRALRKVTFSVILRRSRPRGQGQIKGKPFPGILPGCFPCLFLVRSARVLRLVCRSAYSLPLVRLSRCLAFIFPLPFLPSFFVFLRVLFRPFRPVWYFLFRCTVSIIKPVFYEIFLLYPFAQFLFVYLPYRPHTQRHMPRILI